MRRRSRPRPSRLVWQSGLAAALALVAACNSDKSTGPGPTPPVSPVPATLTLSKIAVGTVPGGSDTIVVEATDSANAAEGWTAVSSNAGVAAVNTLGDSAITVNAGADTGSAAITVTSASGVTRAIPVVVYSPMVLNVGPLLIAYTDSFTERGEDDDNGYRSWWEPRVPVALGTGWKPLGAVFVNDQSSNVNQLADGTHWAILVKANAQGALAPPDSFVEESAFTGIDFSSPTNLLHWSLWTPVCPNGYVAMGSVAGRGSPYGSTVVPPDTSDATCVRADLTVSAGTANPFNWGANRGGLWTLAPPAGYTGSQAALAAGTFLFQGSLDLCKSLDCRTLQPNQPVLHVLHVPLPVVINTPVDSTPPALHGYLEPPTVGKTIQTRMVLAPFTAVFGASPNTAACHGDSIDWMVNHSPVVQIEQDVDYNRFFYFWNTGPTDLNSGSETITTGVDSSSSQTFSHETGITISANVGIEFEGLSGGVSASETDTFGYSSTSASEAFASQSTTATIDEPAHHAAVAWLLHDQFVQACHDGRALGVMGVLDFADNASLVLTDYPN